VALRLGSGADAASNSAMAPPSGSATAVKSSSTTATPSAHAVSVQAAEAVPVQEARAAADQMAQDDVWSDYGCDDDDLDIRACAAELRGML